MLSPTRTNEQARPTHILSMYLVHVVWTRASWLITKHPDELSVSHKYYILASRYE